MQDASKSSVSWGEWFSRFVPQFLKRNKENGEYSLRQETESSQQRDEESVTSNPMMAKPLDAERTTSESGATKQKKDDDDDDDDELSDPEDKVGQDPLTYSERFNQLTLGRKIALVLTGLATTLGLVGLGVKTFGKRGGFDADEVLIRNNTHLFEKHLDRSKVEKLDFEKIADALKVSVDDVKAMAQAESTYLKDINDSSIIAIAFFVLTNPQFTEAVSRSDASLGASVGSSGVHTIIVVLLIVVLILLIMLMWNYATSSALNSQNKQQSPQLPKPVSATFYNI